VNTDALRLGYPGSSLDAVVFTGGSAYGEEAITAVASGLKDDGVRSGVPGNIGFVTGANIYDFLWHRLNEIYPDKRLAVAALHALRPGIFPLGAQGAGRMAMQGGFFVCGAHSGEGGAFRRIGDVKIAAFVVVNAVGAITDRDGKMVSCHRSPDWDDMTKTSDLIARAAKLLNPDQTASPNTPSGLTNNTTISLIVTNRRMGPSDLQRLAVQVHTSMARAIQPFSTSEDGDTLFAVSTQEVGDLSSEPTLFEIDFIAAETMWDAILASVPNDPVIPFGPEISLSREQLVKLTGVYEMGPNARLDIHPVGAKLTVTLVGPRFYDLGSNPTVLHATSGMDFHVDGRYGTRFSFILGEHGRATGLTMNPGRWAEHGERISD
jgi:L-aminopeptidase/D-esterase-like protein